MANKYRVMYNQIIHNNNVLIKIAQTQHIDSKNIKYDRLQVKKEIKTIWYRENTDSETHDISFTKDDKIYVEVYVKNLIKNKAVLQPVTVNGAYKSIQHDIYYFDQGSKHHFITVENSSIPDFGIVALIGDSKIMMELRYIGYTEKEVMERSIKYIEDCGGKFITEEAMNLL